MHSYMTWEGTKYIRVQLTFLFNPLHVPITFTINTLAYIYIYTYWASNNFVPTCIILTFPRVVVVK
jgi:hypothetical protein